MADEFEILGFKGAGYNSGRDQAVLGLEAASGPLTLRFSVSMMGVWLAQILALGQIVRDKRQAAGKPDFAPSIEPGQLISVGGYKFGFTDDGSVVLTFVLTNGIQQSFSFSAKVSEGIRQGLAATEAQINKPPTRLQ